MAVLVTACLSLTLCLPHARAQGVHCSRLPTRGPRALHHRRLRGVPPGAQEALGANLQGVSQGRTLPRSPAVTGDAWPPGLTPLARNQSGSLVSATLRHAVLGIEGRGPLFCVGERFTSIFTWDAKAQGPWRCLLGTRVIRLRTWRFLTVPCSPRAPTDPYVVLTSELCFQKPEENGFYSCPSPG